MGYRGTFALCAASLFLASAKFRAELRFFALLVFPLEECPRTCPPLTFCAPHTGQTGIKNIPHNRTTRIERQRSLKPITKIVLYYPFSVCDCRHVAPDIPATTARNGKQLRPLDNGRIESKNMQTNGTNLMTASNQWAHRPADQRFETLDALCASVADRRMRSRSVDVDLGTVTAKEEQSTIVLNRGMKSVEPSHWAFGQLAGWIKAPGEYLRKLPTELACQNINHGIQSMAKQVGSLKFMAITRPDSDINTLQAVTSTTYGRIWDADVAQCAQRIVERTNGKFYNPKAYVNGQQRPSGLYASDRDIFVFMIDGGSLLDAGPRAQLNRGFFMWNSETGSRTFGLTTFLFNVVCGNHIVWGAQNVKELRIRHTSGGPTRFDVEAAPSLQAYCESSAQPEIETIRKAQAYMLPEASKDGVVDWLQANGKFSRGEACEAYTFAKAEEGDCRTLWHVVQGLTAYARGFDFVDARVDLETRAGKLINLVS